ncbi:hypothetical protein HanHA300_Chr13g0474861 [Helianthus annuus]|nr:hypothetical protein HanHA300_Chr13g0474861 [Helianthus annuus]KAJ0480333.1 hypothetical protein HanIR_Chr13g0630431 [Helianthus annuus]KAJ0497027.1 hypothetical protein HanHA89_Chr13g0506781 [Helianthus annuus]
MYVARVSEACALCGRCKACTSRELVKLVHYARGGRVHLRGRRTYPANECLLAEPRACPAGGCVRVLAPVE